MSEFVALRQLLRDLDDFNELAPSGQEAAAAQARECLKIACNALLEMRKGIARKEMAQGDLKALKYNAGEALKRMAKIADTVPDDVGVDAE